VLYARQRLGMGAVGFGLITTAMAVIGLAGTACYGWLEKRVLLGVIMRGGLIIETLTHLALALIRWMWLALIVFTIFGAHASIWGTTSTSVRQRAIPAEFQGRVSSVYLTGVVGGLVIGSALGGAVASAWGITAPFWFGFAGSGDYPRVHLALAPADSTRRRKPPRRPSRPSASTRQGEARRARTPG
jgi:MFS family permease